LERAPQQPAVLVGNVDELETDVVRGAAGVGQPFQPSNPSPASDVDIGLQQKLELEPFADGHLLVAVHPHAAEADVDCRPPMVEQGRTCRPVKYRRGRRWVAPTIGGRVQLLICYAPALGPATVSS